MVGKRSEPNAPDTRMQLLVFKIGAQEYGVDVLKLREITRIQQPPRPPGSRRRYERSMMLNGDTIPLVNVRHRLRLSQKAPDQHTRVVVVDNEGELFGLVVDAVSEVLRVEPAAMEPLVEMPGEVNTEFAIGTVREEDRRITLLDPFRLAPEMVPVASQPVRPRN
jgi:purine-binding chemotaxis protein CheW